MAMVEPYYELSVIVTRLGCESVVCLDNHTQWLRRLYVLILFYYCLLFVAFEERRTHPCNHQFQGKIMEHQWRMIRWINSYHYNYTMEEEAHFHAHFGYN